MTEPKPEYNVELQTAVPTNGEFLIARVGENGGSDYFNSLVEFLSFHLNVSMVDAADVVAILSSLARLHRLKLEAQIDEADWYRQPRCNGRLTLHGQTAYAYHAAGGECPLHGHHENERKRLRVYIGRDEVKVKELELAIANQACYEDAVRRHYEMSKRLRRAQSMVGSLVAQIKRG